MVDRSESIIAFGTASRRPPRRCSNPRTQPSSATGTADVALLVHLKMRCQFGFQIADLTVELYDDADRCAGAGPERDGDRGRDDEMLGAQQS